jgi:hypothetical protein
LAAAAATDAAAAAAAAATLLARSTAFTAVPRNMPGGWSGFGRFRLPLLLRGRVL